MTNGCGGCGGCNDCRQSIQINQIATCGSVFGQLCTDSEVYLKSSGCNTSCCSLGVDICRLVSNNKIVSPDGTILIDTEPTYTSINGQLVQTDCKMTLEGNDTFYVNGEKVFCRDSDIPSERNWCIIGEGVNISFVSQADDCLPCGTGCKAMKLSVTEASVAKEIRVGCTSESVNQLDIIRNPTGSVNFRFDCNLFDVTPTNLVVPVGSYDTADISLKKTPIATINGIGPDGNQNYNLCDVAPIRITSSATECGVNSPGSKVQLDYNTDQFTVNGSDELELACNFLPNIAEFTDKKDFCGAMKWFQDYIRGNNLQIGGQATEITLDVATSPDRPSTNPSYPDSSGNTMETFIPKVTLTTGMSDSNVLNINSIAVPVPPVGLQYYAYITFHANILTDTANASMPDNSRINFTIIPEIDGQTQFGSGSDYQDQDTIVHPAAAKSALRSDKGTFAYVGTPLSPGTHVIKLVLWIDVLTNAGLALADYPVLKFGELKYRGHLMLVPLSGNRLT